LRFKRFYCLSIKEYSQHKNADHAKKKTAQAHETDRHAHTTTATAADRRRAALPLPFLRLLRFLKKSLLRYIVIFLHYTVVPSASFCALT
jgi:hypothetical protein